MRDTQCQEAQRVSLQVGCSATCSGADCLCGRPRVQEHVRVRIQRQLSRLQRPDYIQTLEVCACLPYTPAAGVTGLF